MEILISLLMGYWFFKETTSWKTWAGLGLIAAGVVLVKQK
jgi:drug/metabolite transporter (DMT)-like permease